VRFLFALFAFFGLICGRRPGLYPLAVPYFLIQPASDGRNQSEGKRQQKLIHGFSVNTSGNCQRRKEQPQKGQVISYQVQMCSIHFIVFCECTQQFRPGA